MKKILVSSTNEDVIKTVLSVYVKFTNQFDLSISSSTEDTLSNIDYELPEIKILDFSSEDIDCQRVLNAIDSDPWLHNGGIIAVAKNGNQVQEIEELKNPNILCCQNVRNFCENFDRLLNILWSNKQFLFNRGLGEKIGGIESGSFICENNPFDLKMYAGFLVNYLYCTNRINDDGRYALQTTLMEMLTNALEHGNCNISYEEKTSWLENGGNIIELIERKLQDPEIGARKIYIEYMIGKETSQFSIRDEGKGFDWHSRIGNSMDFSEETHGRGISLSKKLVSSMEYNDSGNKVTFKIDNIQNQSNTVPMIMSTFSTIKYKRHQIVCKQNEPSNNLFFIVSGRYGVYVDGKLISVLTTGDMFIGEMAFLLNDRRSATIMSAGEGELIKIPKASFLNLIRTYPHYGIFLSKLLAQRVSNTNKRAAKLAKEVETLKELQNA